MSKKKGGKKASFPFNSPESKENNMMNLMENASKNFSKLEGEYQKSGTSSPKSAVSIGKKATNSASSSATILDRLSVFENFQTLYHYPLDKIKILIDKMGSKSNIKLDFTGVEQLTDIVFATILSNDGGKKSTSVTELILQGCLHITDSGLEWASVCFPGLKSINLSGCTKITEHGLSILLNNCKNLNSLDLTGTDISIIPVSLAKKDVVLAGCPLVSPDWKTLETNGMSFLEKPVYPKPADEDIVSVNVIRSSSTQNSFVKFLKKQKDLGVEPAEYLPNYPIGSTKIKLNISEYEQHVMDLFVTKRTLFILTFEGQKAEEVAKELYAIICSILSKCQTGFFLITGLHPSKTKKSVDPYDVVKALQTMASATVKKFQTMLTLNTPEKLKDVTFETQQLWSKGQALMMALSMLKIQPVSVILDTALTDQPAVTLALETGSKAVINLFPAYKEVNSSLYRYLASDKIKETLKGGILSVKESSNVARKSMELQQIFGKAVCLTIDINMPVVSEIGLLMSILCIAQGSPPADSLNQTQIPSLTNNVPVWTMSMLEGMFKDKIPKEQIASVINILGKLPIGLTSSVYASFKNIDKTPLVYPGEDFGFEKKGSMLQTKCRYTFYHPVHSIVIHRLAHLCTKLRRPVCIWQDGFIIQEGLVEILVELRHSAGSSQLVLISQSPLINKDHKESTAKTTEIVWQLVLQYKILVDYILLTHSLSANVTCESDAKKPDKVEGVVVRHKMGFVDGEEQNKLLLCNICGITSSICIGLQAAKHVVHAGIVPPNFILHGKSVKGSGSVIFNENEEGSCTLGIHMSPFDQNILKVTILDCQSTNINISIGPVKFGLGAGAVMSVQNGKEQKIGDLKPVTQGDTYTFEMGHHTEGSNLLYKLMVFRAGEMTSTFALPPSTYTASLTLGETGKEARIMVHGFTPLSAQAQLEVGMRLEALDRLNPSLICCATIDGIADDGKILIHFDGWTARYDYWTEPDSADLHPVGYMARQSADMRSKGKDPRLQIPHGYRGNFTWETYCKEINNLPVPFSFFSNEQADGTTSELTDKIYEEAGVISGKREEIQENGQSVCTAVSNTTRKMEFNLIQRTSLTSEVVQFFSNHKRLFCLFPSTLSLKDVRYPSLVRTVLAPKQNIHFLCPGLRMEILHFVNDAGIPFDKFSPDGATIQEFAPFLGMCYTGLLLQEGFLPSKYDKIIPNAGLSGEEELHAMELGLKRLCYLYMMWADAVSSTFKSKRVGSDDRMKLLMNIGKDEDAKKQLANHFKGFEGDGYSRCIGHYMSINSSKSMETIKMDTYEMYRQFIQRLDFKNNGMETLPDNFFTSFFRIEELDISENKISVLPGGIDTCAYLTHLNISKNNIAALPQELTNLSGTLTFLDISHNPLKELPTTVLELQNLEELHASNIGYVKDLKKINTLTKLEKLSLAYNIIESVPDELAEVPLVELNLSGVPWFPQLVIEKIQPTFQKFRALLDDYIVYRMMPEKKKQDLFSKVDKDANGTLELEELITMNQLLFEMSPRFGGKNLAFAKSGGVPDVIFKIQTLQKLILAFHDLKELPEGVSSLKSLRSIDLSSNPNLVALSPVTGLLPLEDLDLEDCPSLKTPPREVVTRGFSAVFGYLRRLGVGAVSCRRTKLMMVGLGGAGKTSLAQALMSSHSQANINYDEAITDGIDIVNWNVPIKNEDPIQYGVWDFAGQTVYYNTHQFFLSNRAVYLLLWNIRLGYEHAGLDFWLSSIACHAPKAPILVIGTHCDKVEKSAIPQKELQRMYPQISGFYFVSSYTGEGVVNLRESLIKTTLAQKYMGEKIPEAWLSMEKEIVKFKARKEDPLDLLPWPAVDEIAASCGIIDDNEVTQAVEFLHDLGSVQFFNTEFLKGYVVIHPQWIVDVMACIVTVHVGPVKEGKILHKDMKVIWKDYPPNIHPWLLRLTEEFDLTFPLREEDANLVPCLLPDTEYVYEWPAVKSDKGEKESKILYNFKYLPAGLFNRAQVRLHEFSEGGKIWKKGMILKKNGHLAVMLQSKPAQVTVKAQGFKPENILFLVHEVFESLINEAYSGVQYDYQIPCIECNSMHLTDPSMFSASRIQRAMELHAPFVQCENMFHSLSIPELKAVMPPNKTADFDNHLRRSIQELHDIDEDLKVNVFFVYSSKNVPSAKDKNKLVSPLTIMDDMRKEGINVSFCDNPESASLETLTLAFKTAKVVLIGISDEFIFDNQCKQLLLYVKETLRKPIQLIVFGQGKKWESSDISLNIGDEVYVKMDNIDRYPFKIKELFAAVKKKGNTKNAQTEEIPKCFISYCWSNSKHAVDKGSKLKDGALGWGDPRKLKKYLSDKGIKCWIDIERLGGGGLFEDIAEGLRKAKVMVACVSDEYANSGNCTMEFRFAAAKLKIPLILVVVGTGYQWEHTEIGLLAVGNRIPKVNLQYENPGALIDIFQFVQENLPKEEEENTDDAEEQREKSFQEVLEMSQRQFLRHVMSYAQSQHTTDYPRLIVIDFKDKKSEEEEPEKTANREEEDKKGEEECKPAEMEEEKEEEENNSRFCYRLLCEHEEGWHDADSSVPFQNLSPEDEEAWLQEMAPYCARILAILKYTNLPLDCLNTADGKLLQQKFENVVSQDNNPDFKKAYTTLWKMVMNLDSQKHHGGLKRCQLLNGKKLWLCQKHSQEVSSKTEKKFKEELNVKQRELVKEEKPTVQVAAKPVVEKKASDAAAAPKVFQMRQTSNKPKVQHRPSQMKRQSSQACNVM